MAQLLISEQNGLPNSNSSNFSSGKQSHELENFLLEDTPRTASALV
jgi:hypothetical protein